MRVQSVLLPYSAAALLPEEHPLFDELCLACRSGDLARVKVLVESDVPINRRDKFDSVPLYYASLCGHKSIVEFLLTKGAILDPTAFEGERTLYGALTDDIRKLLLSHKLNKAVDPQSNFALFSYALFISPLSHYADIHFQFSTASVYAHRCILSSRSTYFAAQLATRWKDVTVVPVKHPRVHLECFKAVLLFLYTGQLARDVPAELHDDYTFISRQWKLMELHNALTSEEIMTPLSSGNIRIRASGGNDQNHQQKAQAVLIRDMASVQRHLSILFWWIVNGGNRWSIEGRYRHTGVTSAAMIEKFNDLRTRTTEEIEKERGLQNRSMERQSQSTTLMDTTLPPFGTSQNADNRRLRASALRPSNVAMAFLSACHPDIILEVGNRKFPCHRAFLSRSEYFEAMLSGRFSDVSWRNYSKESVENIPIVALNAVPDSEVLISVLEFLYTDRVTLRSFEHSLNVLYTADLLLLDRLKSLTVTYLVSLPEIPPDPYALLRASWRLNLPRLEQHITRHFATTLEVHINSEKFIELVEESSESIRNRHDYGDTVIFVDDLRYYLARLYQIDPDEEADLVTAITMSTSSQPTGEHYFRRSLVSKNMMNSENEFDLRLLVQEERKAEYGRLMRLLDEVLERLGLDI